MSKNAEGDQTPDDELQKRWGFFGETFDEDKTKRWLLPLSSFVLYVLSLTVVVLARRFQSAYGLNLFALAALAGWTIGPPLWFMVEYSRMKKRTAPLPSIDAFKYSQDLAAKFWLAGLGLLVAIATGRAEKIGLSNF